MFYLVIGVYMNVGVKCMESLLATSLKHFKEISISSLLGSYQLFSSILNDAMHYKGKLHAQVINMLLNISPFPRIIDCLIFYFP